MKFQIGDRVADIYAREEKATVVDVLHDQIKVRWDNQEPDDPCTYNRFWRAIEFERVE